MFKTLDALANSLPEKQLFSQSTLSRLEKNLLQANTRTSPARWSNFALAAALVVGLLAFILALFALDFPLAFAVFFIAFSLAFLVFLRAPAFAARARGEIVERDLGVALRAASIELNSGASFERVMRELSFGYGELSGEFSRVLSSVARGSGFGEAFRASGERVDSLLFKRACAQLAFVYEHGLKGEGLRKLADELLLLQKTSAREFNAKASFFGLLFIAVSCIMPALFGAYVIVGSSFLSFSFSSSEVLAAFVLLFPLLDLALLLFLRAKTPKFLAS